MGYIETVVERRSLGWGPQQGEVPPGWEEAIISASCQNMASFSITGKLVGTFSILCLNPSQDISIGALEALNYLFIILVLQRSKWTALCGHLQLDARNRWIEALFQTYHKRSLPLAGASERGMICHDAVRPGDQLTKPTTFPWINTSPISDTVSVSMISLGGGGS